MKTNMKTSWGTAMRAAIVAVVATAGLAIVCVPSHADDSALTDRLETTIRDLPALRQRDFRQIAAAYDWTRMAPRWDAMMERIVG